MRKFLHGFIGLLSVLVLTASFASAQTNYYVSVTGNDANDGFSSASAKATINGALLSAAAGDIIHVAPGTYTEKVNINKQGIKLISTGGAAFTFINPSTAAGVGTIAVQSGINNVTIGESGKGFTITGFDGDGAIETGAVYLSGAHQNIRIEGNNLVANGEHGLGSNNNTAIDNIIINDNIFSGKTFIGNEPGGCGFSLATQFSLGNNAPRQLVVLGGGATVTNSKNITFTNNKLIGTTGGYNSALGCFQGNTQVTIDVIGATISGNIFDGVTTGGSNLRTRGNATSISCNTFYNRNLGPNATHIFLFDQDPLTGANPGSITGILEANAFPDGGAAFTSGYIAGNSGTYFIYRDAAQATTVNQLLGTSFTIANGPTALANLPELFGYSVVSDLNNCGAIVNLPMPSANAFCSTVIASVTNNAPGNSFFEVGTTQVVWTVTDIHGNTDTAWQFVTVIDNQNPTIHPITSVVSCANATGSYALPPLSVSDNCGIGSVAYVVTGATNRTGIGMDATGSFNVGVSTITYTVTDIHGNSSSYAYDVTINAAAAASFNVSSPDAFCNQLSLTANGSAGASYNWSFDGNTVGSQQILNLSLTNPDGSYQLQVTDANGCVSTPATYLYQKQQFVGSYTLLATNKLDLGIGNKVASGSVGVSGNTGTAIFERNSSVDGSGSFVKAPIVVRNGSGINLSSVVYGRAIVSLPTMQNNTVLSTRNLSNYTVNRNSSITLSGNYNNLTIRKGADVVLNGNTFGQISIEEGARVRFTQTVLNIGELNLQQGNSSSFTTTRFAAGTSVRISGKVQIAGYNRINPDQHKVTLYLGDLINDDEIFYVKGSNIQFTANVYVPSGKIQLLGEQKGWSVTNSNVSMTGFFIAKEIESTIPNVTWNSYACASQPVVVSNAWTSSQFLTDEDKQNDEPFKVQVIGNPTTSFFTLKLQSQQLLPIQMRVSDASGRIVDNRTNNQPNSTLQFGQGYTPGTYYAEFIQGTNRKVVQLMKIR